MKDWIGRTLSKVKIERKLGRGGMAEVYLGRHTTLNRPVAVKILQAHLQEDEDLKRRFMAEAQSVAALRHPNIVQVFDYDVVEGQPYIVMELLQGYSLSEYLSKLHDSGITLPISSVSRLIKKLAAALDYAHERGIVHRDVKPANIMLRQGSQPIDPSAPLPPDVEPILTDFGVARLTHATTQTATGTVLGTPAYMSPEQVRGVGIDSRSDIYSLGIVLYELLSGEPPFNHETTPAAVLVKHLNEQPAPIPQASPGIRAVVRKALAKDPGARYQTAGELAGALEAEVVGTVPPGSQRRRTAASSSKRSLPVGCWIVGALGLAGFLVILAVGGFLGLRSLRAARAQSTETAIAAAPAATQPPTTEAPTPQPEASPTPSAPDPTEPLGTALLQGNTLTLQLQDVPPPPEGFTYHVWLRRRDDSQTALGPAQHSGNQLSFSHQAEGDLTAQAAALLISVEPNPDPDPDSVGEVHFQGELDGEIQGQLALLTDVAGQGSPHELVTSGLDNQAVHFNSHLGFALDGVSSRSLPAAKLHSEHVINIVDGRDGSDYGDWNGDGRVENPGDDVGLIPYLSLLRSLIEGGQGLTPEDNPAVEQAASAKDTCSALLDEAESVRDLATRVAAADTLEEVQPLAEELRSYQIRPQIEQLLSEIEPLQLALTVQVFPVPR